MKNGRFVVPSVVVQFKSLSNDAKAPIYATSGSAGADICSTEDVTIEPNETKLIRTGLAMMIPSGFVGLMFPRSGLSLRTPLRQPNSVGVIDSDYRGEIRGMFENRSAEPVRITNGMRIAQLVLVPYVYGMFVRNDLLDETERGEGGFGSTGV